MQSRAYLSLCDSLWCSLDAGASSIQVVVKAGGLKLIQIQDSGSGIRVRTTNFHEKLLVLNFVTSELFYYIAS